MDERTLEALKKSIKKWENVAYYNGADQGVHNCALCKEFIFGKSISCVKCPVYIRTHSKYCNNTPYEDWIDHQKLKHSLKDNKAWCEECKKLAIAELEFLKSLLPKEEV